MAHLNAMLSKIAADGAPPEILANCPQMTDEQSQESLMNAPPNVEQLDAVIRAAMDHLRPHKRPPRERSAAAIEAPVAGLMGRELRGSGTEGQP